MEPTDSQINPLGLMIPNTEINNHVEDKHVLELFLDFNEYL